MSRAKRLEYYLLAHVNHGVQAYSRDVALLAPGLSCAGKAGFGVLNGAFWQIKVDACCWEFVKAHSKLVCIKQRTGLRGCGCSTNRYLVHYPTGRGVSMFIDVTLRREKLHLNWSFVICLLSLLPSGHICYSSYMVMNKIHHSFSIFLLMLCVE